MVFVLFSCSYFATLLYLGLLGLYVFFFLFFSFFANPIFACAIICSPVGTSDVHTRLRTRHKARCPSHTCKGLYCLQMFRSLLNISFFFVTTFHGTYAGGLCDTGATATSGVSVATAADWSPPSPFDAARSIATGESGRSVGYSTNGVGWRVLISLHAFVRTAPYKQRS
jgi:hypothetical protein